ncbi:hypothetical protein [Janibacter alittae]|uniref:Uncharacterized protein n=1 Tax=Janibacter alittae TaxID=3115209 RepID=A0ABZ2ML22_9MICO
MIRRTAGRASATVASALALVLVWGALVLPSAPAAPVWGSLLRFPLGALIVLAVLLVVPVAARRAVTLALGALLTLVVGVTALDIGFSVVMDRRFHALYDVAVRREALVVRVEVRDLCLIPCRSRESVAGGSLIAGTCGRAGAAPTKPCRVSTVGWRGRGEQAEEVYARNRCHHLS